MDWTIGQLDFLFRLYFIPFSGPVLDHFFGLFSNSSSSTPLWVTKVWLSPLPRDWWTTSHHFLSTNGVPPSPIKWSKKNSKKKWFKKKVQKKWLKKKVQNKWSKKWSKSTCSSAKWHSPLITNHLSVASRFPLCGQYISTKFIYLPLVIDFIRRQRSRNLRSLALNLAA